MRQKGFSLIELVTALSILGIFLVVGVPAFRELIQNHRAATLTNEFVAAIHLARSEAIRRGVPVTICASGNTSQTSCGGAGNWTNGWIVFIDPNGDGTIATANDKLKIQQVLPTGAIVTTTQARITFSASGYPNIGAGNGASGLYTLAASGCYGNHGRAVSVSSTGRISITNTAC